MSKGFLTTHVLDTARGRPAEGLEIRLYTVADSGRELIATATTNADGRTDSPILPEGRFAPGVYELVFAAGDYLRSHGEGGGGGGVLFLDEVPVRFGIGDADQHYHVPLLLSPYGYSTYRGS